MTANLAHLPQPAPKSKTARFRELLTGRKMAFIMEADGSLEQGDVPSLLNRLIASGHTIKIQYITGPWLDIDDALDLAPARNLL